VEKVVISLSVEEAQALALAAGEGFASAHEAFSKRGKFRLAAALRTAYKAAKRAEAEAIMAATGK